MIRAPAQRGLSVIELLAALVVLMALALAATPPLTEIVRSSRLKAAVRRLASDVQGARSRAVSTGWEYRVVGFGAAAASSLRNRYRVMARSSSSLDWPDETALAFEDDDQIVREWVDLAEIYPGIAVNPSDSQAFGLTFDARGTPVDLSLNFDPLAIADVRGVEQYLSVSAAGAVRIE
jgi:Tfp pilus assembly protein FimT